MDQLLVSIVKIYFTTGAINSIVHVSGNEEDCKSNVTFISDAMIVTHNMSICIDGMLEVNDTFMFIIDPSSLPSNVTIGDPGNATVIIVDNDSK